LPAQLGISLNAAFCRLCRARHKRHCFGTHLIEAGAPIHAVKELMGHQQIATTMIYLHLTHRIERDCRDLIQALCQGLPR
jgi:site-specific recombinase XerD